MPRADRRLRSASSPISAPVRRRQRREPLSGHKSVNHVPGLFCQLSPRPLTSTPRSLWLQGYDKELFDCLDHLGVRLRVVGDRDSTLDARIARVGERLLRLAVHDATARHLLEEGAAARRLRLRELDRVLERRVVEDVMRAGILGQRDVLSGFLEALDVGAASGGGDVVVRRAVEDADRLVRHVQPVDEDPVAGRIEPNVAGEA